MKVTRSHLHRWINSCPFLKRALILPILAAFAEAVTLGDLKTVLRADDKVKEQITAHPAIEGAWLVSDEFGFTRAVTFDHQVLDEYSPDVRLLSPDDPLFDLVLRRASSPIAATDDGSSG